MLVRLKKFCDMLEFYANESIRSMPFLIINIVTSESKSYQNFAYDKTKVRIFVGIKTCQA
jgi:hypothetical protein